MKDREFELLVQEHQAAQGKPPQQVRYLMRDIEVARRRREAAVREMDAAEEHLQELLNLLHRMKPR